MVDLLFLIYNLKSSDLSTRYLLREDGGCNRLRIIDSNLQFKNSFLYPEFIFFTIGLTYPISDFTYYLELDLFYFCCEIYSTLLFILFNIFKNY